MHHLVTLSGLAAVVLALWAVQLTVLALHIRYAIHHGIGEITDSEFALLFASGIITLLSAIGGGNAITATTHASQWGWAHGVLAIGATLAYMLLSYATDWSARNWWDKRKERKTGHSVEAAETVA